MASTTCAPTDARAPATEEAPTVPQCGYDGKDRACGRRSCPRTCAASPRTDDGAQIPWPATGPRAWHASSTSCGASKASPAGLATSSSPRSSTEASRHRPLVATPTSDEQINYSVRTTTNTAQPCEAIPMYPIDTPLTPADREYLESAGLTERLLRQIPVDGPFTLDEAKELTRHNIPALIATLRSAPVDEPFAPEQALEVARKGAHHGSDFAGYGPISVQEFISRLS